MNEKKKDKMKGMKKKLSKELLGSEKEDDYNNLPFDPDADFHDEWYNLNNRIRTRHRD